MGQHLINGKKTAVHDIVHYLDHDHIRHAARIKELHGETAHLQVFHAHGPSKDTHVADVVHSATPAPHTWTHLPE